MLSYDFQLKIKQLKAITQYQVNNNIDLILS